ncbi:MAG: Uma2 family endonuclease [Bryobacterales bacterium]|nr:Uma2 family endonuclease [Bryobacterales bacterium]
MADNTWQARAMISTHACLEHHFRHRQDVAVCIDLLVYYLDGDGTGSVAPDVFVKFGCEKRDRMTYKVWDEAGPPDFVLEVASPNMVHNDLADKSTIYARMGVREYWMFDPMGSLLDPRLQGFELAGNSYREFSEVNREGVDLARYSRVLELEFHQRGDRLRIWNPWTGEYLPTLREEARLRKTAELERRAAERRRKEEARLRKAAELERNEEARLRREAERRRNEEVRLRRAAEQKTHELQRVIADLQSKLTPQ